jgi:hypothetical protein
MMVSRPRQEVLPAEATPSRPRRWRRDGWTPLKMGMFLEVLEQTASVRDACRAVSLSKTSAYRLYEQDQGFAAAWDRALAAIRPSLEETAYQRAVIGWEEPVFHAGQVVGYRRHFSDGLLRLLIERGFDPVRKMKEAQGKDPISEKLLQRLEGLARVEERRREEEQRQREAELRAQWEAERDAR